MSAMSGTGTDGRCEGSGRYVPRMAAFGCMDDDAWGGLFVVVDLGRRWTLFVVGIADVIELEL